MLDDGSWVFECFFCFAQGIATVAFGEACIEPKL